MHSSSPKQLKFNESRLRLFKIRIDVKFNYFFNLIFKEIDHSWEILFLYFDQMRLSFISYDSESMLLEIRKLLNPNVDLFK